MIPNEHIKDTKCGTRCLVQLPKDLVSFHVIYILESGNSPYCSIDTFESVLGASLLGFKFQYPLSPCFFPEQKEPGEPGEEGGEYIIYAKQEEFCKFHRL